MWWQAVYVRLDGSPEEVLNVKILLVTGSFPPGKCGVGDYSYRLAKALAAQPGMHVGVLTSVSFGDSQTHEGIEMFPIVHGWRLREIQKFVKLVRSWSPDIVHVQYPTQGYMGGLLSWFLPLVAFMLGKKVVQTWHEIYGNIRIALPFFAKAVVPGGLVVVRPEYKQGLHPLFRLALSKRKFVYIRSASSIPRIHLGAREIDELRVRYLKGQKRLIVFFGFVYPNKGVELLFEIANPVSDHIVIAGETGEGGEYRKQILELASSGPWKDKVTITGFLSPRDAAALLSIADAVILPFRVGGGEWNTSIHAVVLQGTFIITTSKKRNGYDDKHNVYYAKVDDVPEMRAALDAYAGKRRESIEDSDGDEWQRIAVEHISLYRGRLIPQKRI